MLTMAWRLRATRLAMGGAAGIVSASFANCNTATQTDAAAKLKSTLSSGSPPISVAPDHMLFAIPKKGRLNEKLETKTADLEPRPDSETQPRNPATMF